MKTIAPSKEEALCFETIHDWESMSLEELDDFISKLKTPRLLALAEFLRSIKVHWEAI